MKKIRRKAFTLAELIITLVIIGVVAAVSLPGLMTNLQDVHLKASGREAEAILSSALTRMLADNAGEIWDYNSDNGQTGDGYMRTEFGKYITYTNIDDAENLLPDNYYPYRGYSGSLNWSIHNVVNPKN